MSRGIGPAFTNALPEGSFTQWSALFHCFDAFERLAQRGHTPGLRSFLDPRPPNPATIERLMAIHQSSLDGLSDPFELKPQHAREIAEALDEEDWSRDPWDQWFNPARGREVVVGLLKALEAHEAEWPNLLHYSVPGVTEAAMAERCLVELHDALLKAEAAGARFQLLEGTAETAAMARKRFQLLEVRRHLEGSVRGLAEALEDLPVVSEESPAWVELCPNALRDFDLDSVLEWLRGCLEDDIMDMMKAGHADASKVGVILEPTEPVGGPVGYRVAVGPGLVGDELREHVVFKTGDDWFTLRQH